MPEFSELERAFWERVEAAALKAPASPDTAAAVPSEGFAEAPEAFSYSESGREIEAAENACLGFEATSGEELQDKVQFILRLMRRLTDETEEFDAYAERLKADIERFASRWS